MILSFKKKWPWNGEPTRFPEKIKSGEKVHTIREDQHRRWREGMDIHFATGLRTPQYNQFESGVCSGVQEIRMLYHNIRYMYRPVIHIDDRQLDLQEAKIFARNDGFDSWEQFKQWFDEDFKGRIIHWTELRY